ncbi:unnamed protein product [Arabidopsis arenosa]|uniref:Uncharacterized protein n=1 Tax=Arabidopsis arenosa TaxID=38785 RepID=A0A8S1ZD32_ARAAE|nr:unnamed protein product [Arabidopsis arenosa]
MSGAGWDDKMISKYYDAVLRHGHSGENMIQRIAEDLGVEESEVQREARKLRNDTKMKKKNKAKGNISKSK